ncbi:hypothetical protein [Fimbriiglobus ruber]|uniref:Uncharacterized protein n=1 Tax=Fimbriiglobus ruber TaxID=1908690 RepID=A0A225DGX5_9BACT|nr:hypothetical protein [Fimbriiglobus ruber]OWK38934.1 hypothetical protein FRUB_06310 [Fimbriiglobus ruber]OWK38968.1 hypothetical protein FRUB_06344 [Fimbriiglobus ruber]
MNGSISDLVRQARGEKPSPAPAAPAKEAEEPPEEHACYAKLRGARQIAFMLELRLTGGDSDSFDYGLLGRCTFNRSEGVTLFFATGTVTICGKNLRPLFEAILAHRVAWVAVAEEPSAVSRDPEATVVTTIGVDPAK